MEQQQVMEFLEPWLECIARPFHEAMQLYNEDYPSSVRAEHDDSVAAHIVHLHAVYGWEREFSDTKGFHVLECRGLMLVNIKDVLVGRIKKVDEEGHHRNHDSNQQRDFDRQLSLPGLPPSALRVTFGYEPDPAFSKCVRVMVARPQGRSIMWASQIVEEEGSASWVDITPRRFTGTAPIPSGIRFQKPS